MGSSKDEILPSLTGVARLRSQIKKRTKALDGIFWKFERAGSKTKENNQKDPRQLLKDVLTRTTFLIVTKIRICLAALIFKLFELDFQNKNFTMTLQSQNFETIYYSYFCFLRNFLKSSLTFFQKYLKMLSNFLKNFRTIYAKCVVHSDEI